MKKRFIPIIILIIYIAILIKVMVFKDIPTIRVGSLMLNFGGTDGGHPANFIPFKTIGPYLLGYKGWIIAGINLFGNIALLIPIGLIVPYVDRHMTWKKALILAVLSGLVVETMQTVLHVGIFDIDDVILNAFGVMIGYWAFMVISRWVRAKKYVALLVAALLVIAAAIAVYAFVIYPTTHQPINYDLAQRGQMSQGGDLCGGTGGTGQIVSKGNDTFTIKSRTGVVQVVVLAKQATIKALSGPITVSDLKIGDHATLVGGPNSTGGFTADIVLVCTTLGQN